MAYSKWRLFESVQDYLQRNPAGTSLSAIARRLGVDRHTVERAVRDATGMSFRDWKSQTVALRATKLLRGIDAVSVKLAAFALGYKSSQALGRFLKRKFKCSATELRKNTVLR